MTHFDRHSFILDENVQIRSLHDYVSKKKGQQVRLVPKPLREITLIPGVNQRRLPKLTKPLEQRHIVLKSASSRTAEEKKTAEDEEKPQIQESTPKREDAPTHVPETEKKEETPTPNNTQSTPTNSTENDLFTDHPDMYFAD